MKNLIYYFIVLLAICSTTVEAQILEIGCSGHEDAFIGLDRKNWNGGSTEIHSEGMFHNFFFPDEIACKSIEKVDIDITVFLVDDSGISDDCGAIVYFVNVYSGCESFEPASCPTTNIVAEPNSQNFNSQNLSFSSNDFEFLFGDTLGVDIVPAIGNTGCNNGQSAISAGDIVLEYEICIKLTLADEEISMEVDLGDDLTICDNESVSLDAGPDFTSYEWAPGGETTQVIEVPAGVYSVTVSDENGCTDSDTIEIKSIVPAVELISSDDNGVICEGESLELFANTDAQSILWSTGDTTKAIIASAGLYSVTVTDENGCSSVAETNITESIPTVVILVGDDDLQLCEGQTTEIEAISDAEKVLWSTGESTSVIVAGPGTYSVTVTDTEGCTAEGMVSISEIEISETILETSLCAGESVIVNGVEYTTTGSFTQELETQDGCDSLVIINISQEFGCEECDLSETEGLTIGAQKVNNNLYRLTINNNTVDLESNQLTAFINHLESLVNRQQYHSLASFLDSEQLKERINPLIQEHQSLSRSYRYIQEVRDGARLKINFKLYK